MNETERARIAAAVNQLRPDWPLASLLTLLARPELASRPRRDLAVALTWVACDSDTRTPGRVVEAGPWWQATSEGGASRPPAWTDRCEVCSRTEDVCGRIYPDHKFAPNRRTRPEETP